MMFQPLQIVTVFIVGAYVLCNMADIKNIYAATGGETWIPFYKGSNPENGTLECRFLKRDDTKDRVIILCKVPSAGCGLLYSEYRGRLEVLFSNFTIQLKNLSKEDSGRYFCSVKKPYSEPMTTTSHLHVLDPISDLHVTASFQHSNATAQFQCSFNGEYEIITWVKDGMPISSDCSHEDIRFLSINKADRSDCGYYSCIVHTHIGSFENGTEFKIPSSDLKAYVLGLSIFSVTEDIMSFFIIVLAYILSRGTQSTGQFNPNLKDSPIGPAVKYAEIEVVYWFQNYRVHQKLHQWPLKLDHLLASFPTI
ncbi:neural cell adhesion molecule L1.1-like [Pelobates fuscus]|uniref:neural cell adhesion molecule L1.1-like n=1 Tax=Pelobates fuscus TaxID=191477 RepID=UPI002FE4A335